MSAERSDTGTTRHSPQPGAHRTLPRATSGEAGVAVIVVVLALLVVGVAVGAGAGWLYYRTTPQYALARLSEAIADSDWEAVEAYADVDSITERLVDDAAEEVEGDLPDLGGLEDVLAEALKPVAAEELESDLREAVESGEAAARMPTGVRAHGFALRNADVTVEDGSALAVITVPYEGEDIEIELGMRETDGGWRVVEVRNALELYERLR
jgi:hypothetical protein